MDAQTQMILEQASEGILAHARDEEKKMAMELEKMEKMDEDDFEVLRQKRKLLMMKKIQPFPLHLLLKWFHCLHMKPYEQI